MIKKINILFFTLFIKSILNNEFLFSVIISIYNTGRYLNESIESIFNQTISPNKIQIILVNDGSIDISEEISLNYNIKHPNNIIYIKIKHSGVSLARNIGIKYSKGNYINFLDADDKWDNQAFKYALLFFRMYTKVNIIACRLIFFEIKKGPHRLDYKFYQSKSVNLIKEYNCIQLSSSSCFFRFSSIKDQKFKEGVFTGEDTRFINNILLLNPILGILKEAIYYYRKRSDYSSTVQNQIKKKKYYFSVIKSVDQYLIEKSKKLYNLILPFIQFFLAYDILFRISAPSYKYMKKKILKKYYKEIDKILLQIEDKYILEQKIVSTRIKIVALSKKYKRDIRNEIVFHNNLFIYSEHILVNMDKVRNILELRVLNIENNIVHLEGRDNFILAGEKFFYFCKLGNKFYYPNYFHVPSYDLKTIYKSYYKGRNVIFDIFLENKKLQIIQFFISYNNFEIEIVPSFDRFTYKSTLYNNYYYIGKFIIKFIEGKLHIYQYNTKLRRHFEKQFYKDLIKIKKNDIIQFRKKYFKDENKNKYNKEEIWIINDKPNIAGDNGEYFFRFLKKKKPKGIKYYFLIKKNCPDYERLKSFGNILEFGTNNHLNIFLTADKIISSVAESWVVNPFGKDQIYVRDLCHFTFILIQNIYIINELYKYVNKIDKNLNFTIVLSNEDYKAIFDKKHGFSKNNFLTTGLPKYDNLQKLQSLIKKERIVLIIPTWRKAIENYENTYSYSFNLTEYFNFYNNLINNNRLLIKMKQFGYIGLFCLHSYFSSKWVYFKQNQIFSVLEKCDYQNLLIKSSLLITDYSNFFFDFAYLKKPIIYAQFDYEEYKKKYPKDYFNYKINGFGPVCYNYECTINKIISKLKDDCYLEKQYLKRIQEFFKFNDGKNCERLLFYLLNNSISNFNNYNKYKIRNRTNFLVTFIFIFLLILKYINYYYLNIIYN